MKFTQYSHSLLLYMACQPVYAHSGKLGLLGESALVAIVLFIALIHLAIILIMRSKQCFRKKHWLFIAYFIACVGLIIWGFVVNNTVSVFLSGDYNGGQQYEFWGLFAELFITFIIIFTMFTIPHQQFNSQPIINQRNHSHD